MVALAVVVAEAVMPATVKKNSFNFGWIANFVIRPNYMLDNF